LACILTLRSIFAYELDYSICLGLGRLDLKNRKLDYLSSGLPDAQLFRGKQIISISTPMNPMIDKMAAGQDLSFQMESQLLNPGDSIFFFTDGAIELVDPKQQRVRSDRDFTRTLAKANGENWRQEVLRELTAISQSEKFPDDVTIMRVHLSEPMI